MAKAHKKHPERLCALSTGGKDLAQARELTKEARFVCAKCGAVARKKKNLCSARRIEQA